MMRKSREMDDSEDKEADLSIREEIQDLEDAVDHEQIMEQLKVRVRRTTSESLLRSFVSAGSYHSQPTNLKPGERPSKSLDKGLIEESRTGVERPADAEEQIENEITAAAARDSPVSINFQDLGERYDADLMDDNSTIASYFEAIEDKRAPTYFVSLLRSLRNSFFAWQLLTCTCLVASMDCAAIVFIIITHFNVISRSQPFECVILPLLTHLLVVVHVLIGLPALAVPLRNTRRRNSSNGGNEKHRVGRFCLYYEKAEIVRASDGRSVSNTAIKSSRYLVICEALVIFSILYIIGIVIAFITVVSKPSITECYSEASSIEFILFVFAAASIVLAFYQIILFGQFRVHQKMQLHFAQLQDSNASPGTNDPGFFREAADDEGSRTHENISDDGYMGRIGPRGSIYQPPTPTRTPTSTDFLDCTNLNVAEEGGHVAPRTHTQDNEAPGDHHSFRQSLFQAVYDNNLFEVERLIANSNYSNKLQELYNDRKRIHCGIIAHSFRNPLHLACALGYRDIVKTLLQAGMSPNAFEKSVTNQFSVNQVYELVSWLCCPSQEGFAFTLNAIAATRRPSSTFLNGGLLVRLLTPLHVAVSVNRVEIVELLVNAGADIDQVALTSVFNKTLRVPPLFMCESFAMMNCLLRSGANLLLIPSERGASETVTISVLQYTNFLDRVALRSMLEEWGADVALTPLHAAAAAGDLETMSTHLKRGVNVNTLGEYYDGQYRRTPLHWAAIMGKTKAIQLLLEQPNIRVDAMDWLGRTPLHWAARRGSLESISALLEAGANPNMLDDEDQSILYFATRGNMIEENAIQALVNAGANINAQLFHSRDTPLHHAVKCQHQDTAIALLHCGADIDILNDEGRTPMDCATSAEVQFRLKQEADRSDLLLCYTPDYHGFATKIRRSIEKNWITTTTRYASNPASLMNVSVMLCILSKDFEDNPECFRELTEAKQHHIPIVAIFCDRSSLSEELQVCLYTRQIVPFTTALVRVQYEVKPIAFEYNEERFNDALRCLIDGIRDELELHRLAKHENKIGRFDTSFRGNISMTKSIRYLLNSSQDIPAPATLGTKTIFLSHGDCHSGFVARLEKYLKHRRFNVIVDSSEGTASLKERIINAKDSILFCSVFAVVLSKESIGTTLVSDQLAYAEDKGKWIVPIIFQDRAFKLRTSEEHPTSETQLSQIISRCTNHRPIIFSSADFGTESYESRLLQAIEDITPATSTASS